MPHAGCASAQAEYLAGAALGHDREIPKALLRQLAWLHTKWWRAGAWQAGRLPDTIKPWRNKEMAPGAAPLPMTDQGQRTMIKHSATK